jgi:hypothetical protein
MAVCKFIENQLCDIHLPEPLPFWPLAPGYWIIIGIIILLIGGSWWLYKYHSQSFKNIALKELKQLRIFYKNDHTQLIINISILLRRVALVAFPHDQVAGLNGIEWLQFLDKTGNTQEFSNGFGKILATSPYQKNTQIKDIEVLFNLVETWINLR